MCAVCQNLVFFNQAIEHISRIARVLRQPRGNAMLVGVGGSGKQSLTRLACFIGEMKCCELELTRGFSYQDFQEFLKKIMVLAGGAAGRETVFLFNENQVRETDAALGLDLVDCRGSKSLILVPLCAYLSVFPRSSKSVSWRT